MDDVIVGIEESTRDDDEALTKFSKHHHYETSNPDRDLYEIS